VWGLQQGVQEWKESAPSLQGSPSATSTGIRGLSKIKNYLKKVFKNYKNLLHHYKAHHQQSVQGSEVCIKLKTEHTRNFSCRKVQDKKEIIRSNTGETDRHHSERFWYAVLQSRSLSQIFWWRL
jgi:hypothetical protein